MTKEEYIKSRNFKLSQDLSLVEKHLGYFMGLILIGKTGIGSTYRFWLEEHKFVSEQLKGIEKLAIIWGL